MKHLSLPNAHRLTLRSWPPVTSTPPVSPTSKHVTFCAWARTWTETVANWCIKAWLYRYIFIFILCTCSRRRRRSWRCVVLFLSIAVSFSQLNSSQLTAIENQFKWLLCATKFRLGWWLLFTTPATARHTTDDDLTTVSLIPSINSCER